MSSLAGAAAGALAATPSIFTKTFMFGIIGSLSMYLASWEKADISKESFLEKHRDQGDTFDFIIVGGGTAGSILANRLSEKYKTLLLEAGGEPHPFQTIPLLSNFLLNYPQLDWRHVTMPQKQAFRGAVQSRASISQGRGLGGTSNLDYMMYLRGHPKDYDNWAEITDDPEWSYTSLLKHFMSLEYYTGPWPSENHGKTGNMKIKQPAYTGLGEKFCKAAQRLGYVQADLNSPFTEGCDILTYPTRKGYRDSAYKSFLKPVKDRWNLVVLKYAHVNKVLIRGNDEMVYGVEYDRNGKSMIAYAKKEVILAAGAIQSPKILMLSGIGPKADLDSSGIPVIADLPVGENLQDHLSVYLGPFFVDKGKSLLIDRDISTRSVLSLAKDIGPLTTTGFQAAAVISSSLEKLHGDRNWPDLQLTMYGISHHSSAASDFSHAYQLKKDLLEKYVEKSKGHDSFSIVVSGGRPKSTGSVKLLNRNPYAPLIINPNYFDKVYDVVVMVDGVKRALRFVENSTAFEDIHAHFTWEYLPGCENFRFRSDAYWECYVRTLSVSLGNVAGTVPMGSVLNSKLEVKGLKGLRVVDASVMPSIVSTSTGAAVMVIAEKGSQLILKDWEGTASKAGGEQGLLKGSKVVFDKIKEGADNLKLGLDSSKTLLDTLKLAVAESNPVSATEQLSLDGLQKLTQSVGDLAAMLGPLPGGSDKFSGSFDVGNETTTESELASMMTLAPMLKSQFGGLYKNLFDDVDELASSPKIKSSTSKPFKNMALSSLKFPILGALKGRPSPNSLDPFKVIQSMLENSMKSLENITTSVKISTSGKSAKPPSEVNKLNNNVTLEDVFGMTEGDQDEWEEYFLDEPLPSPTTQKSTTTTPKRISTTTTTPKRISTTTTTTTPSSTTTKKPLIDYAYEVLPAAQSQKSEKVILVASPIPPKPAKLPRSQRPVHPNPTPTSAPKPRPTSDLQTSAMNSQKLKNLEALAQIQHETMSKLKQKQKQNTGVPHNYRPFQYPTPQELREQYPHIFNSFQTPPTNPTQPAPAQGFPQPQSSHFFPQYRQRPPPPRGLMPPKRGRFPPPLRQGYDQAMKPPFHYRPPSPLLRGYTQARPTADPTDLKFAVNSIMNAKYTYPTKNPFLQIMEYLGQSPNKAPDSESSVLKALQLRTNVDKLLNFPYLLQPSPIAITHRPIPPTPSPSEPPLLSFTPDDSPSSIFAPIKDVLQPITDLMKAPLGLLPKPFAKDSLVASFLPDMFSQRIGPMSSESAEYPHTPTTTTPRPTSRPRPRAQSARNSLAVALPRFFMNHTKENSEIPPEVFLRALANLTHDLPKPFVLEPNKGFSKTLSLSSGASYSIPDKHEAKNRKQLDRSISDILSHLKNHHFANMASSTSDNPRESAVTSPSEGRTTGSSNANEILNIDYTRASHLPEGRTKESINTATPRVKMNPPIEFHKSPWAKEPPIPPKSLHFKIKIIKE